MPRHEPDFEAEAKQQQRQSRVAPRRCREGGDRVADREAPARHGFRHKHERHQQQRLAQHRERQVDAAGAPAGGVAVMHDEAPPRQADDRMVR